MVSAHSSALANAMFLRVIRAFYTRMYGFNKYGEAEDWRSVEPERWHEALLRHVLAIWDDPTHIDEESGLPSLWHVMTNGAFLCACLKDSFKKETEQ